jgi:hypothetical protein
MYMRGYINAFEELLNAVNGADHLEALKLYGTAAALYRDMRDSIELLYPEDARPITYLHTTEKLERFMDAFANAVMRPPAEERSEIELLQSAEQYLRSATSNWPGDDWV